MRRVLILGGTSEASALVRRLADVPDVDATLSLAGRTRHPRSPAQRHAIAVRIGGFGGIDGLRRWLTETATECVIDATHPFAAQMSAHAAAACAAEAVPLARLTRPPWRPVAGDSWTVVPDAQEAVAALGPQPLRVFLPIGRGSLAPFAAAPWHFYLIRSIDQPDTLDGLPNRETIAASPPFSFADEYALLGGKRIEVMVTKNSGGDAVAEKLAAARSLRVPVVMIARPTSPPCHTVHDIDDALAFIRDGR